MLEWTTDLRSTHGRWRIEICTRHSGPIACVTLRDLWNRAAYHAINIRDAKQLAATILTVERSRIR